MLHLSSWKICQLIGIMKCMRILFCKFLSLNSFRVPVKTVGFLVEKQIRCGICIFSSSPFVFQDWISDARNFENINSMYRKRKLISWVANLHILVWVIVWLCRWRANSLVNTWRANLWVPGADPFIFTLPKICFKTQYNYKMKYVIKYRIGSIKLNKLSYDVTIVITGKIQIKKNTKYKH